MYIDIKCCIETNCIAFKTNIKAISMTKEVYLDGNPVQ